MNPIVAPSPRLATGLAYDTESDRTILFGGFIEGRTFLGDTWAYNLDTNVWSSTNPSGAPAARGDPGFAYDSDSDRVVLFAGVTNVGGPFADFNDTWAYDLNRNEWQNLDPASAPSPRHGHKLVYDSESDRIIMVGGHTGSGALATLFGDTWAYDYDNNTWTNMSQANGPSTANFHGFAYGGESDRAVLYGGDGSTARETWAYDFDSNTWTRLNPQQDPGSLSFYAMAYDAHSDRVVLFGGCALFELQCNNETWAYVLAAPPTPGISLLVIGAVSAAGIAVAVAVGALVVRRRRCA